MAAVAGAWLACLAVAALSGWASEGGRRRRMRRRGEAARWR